MVAEHSTAQHRKGKEEKEARHRVELDSAFSEVHFTDLRC
jgi:hypothetical protein